MVSGKWYRSLFHSSFSIFHDSVSTMTERLYYTDPYATEFDAEVLRVEDHAGRAAAVLDRTSFYPTSGGQPFDTGTLGEARVVDVVDGEDGTIRHVIEGTVVAGPVRGRIDWPRRFDHMQQHTGQHVLSAAFDKLAQARTESFHLGSASSTIDLAREVTPAAIERAEDDANRIVWEDRPVHVRFADAAEAAALPLRKESGRTGRLRLIDVEGFDLSACGGTHVERTGAIGVIAVSAWEKFRGGTRVEFVCGGRALKSHRALRDVVAGSIRALSVLPCELPASIERLQGELKDSRKTVKGLQAVLAVHEAARLASEAEPMGRVRAVVAALDGWDAGSLKAIASGIVELPGHVAVLFGSVAAGAIGRLGSSATVIGPPGSATVIGTPGSAAVIGRPGSSDPGKTAAAGPGLAVVIARSADVGVDCAALLRRVTEQLGGKGGGRPELAQGGGVTGPIPDVIAFATRMVHELCAHS
jgi:alanyl-tRNA synthetase